MKEKLNISTVKSISQNIQTGLIEVLDGNNYVVWQKYYKDRVSCDNAFLILSKKLDEELSRRHDNIKEVQNDQ